MRTIYALKNKTISDSASGAAFPTIIEAIKTFKSIGGGEDTRLNVYGALFDKNFTVRHQKVENPEDYIRFRGSKYVQSELGMVFQEVQKDLGAGRYVLFTGTPCQVFSLSHFLKVQNVNTAKLFLVDIVCHGVPGQKIWRDFVLWLENRNHSGLTEFSFRYQKSKWKDYPVMARFNNGKKLVNTHELRLYTKLFFTHMIMRECCYTCKFANLNRPGDLTIGDFWGIEKVLPKFPYKDSVSQILVNTEKGRSVMDWVLNMQGENIAIAQCNTKEYLKYQQNFNQPTEKPEETAQLLEEYKQHGIQFILEKYAGYNLKGKIKHAAAKFLGNTGLRPVINKMLEYKRSNIID